MIKNTLNGAYQRRNVLLYILTALLFIGLKAIYPGTDSKQLDFLIKPTTYLTALLLNSKPVLLENGAYQLSEFNCIIEKSCSGFNFWLLCFIMFSWLAVNKITDKFSRVLIIPGSLIIAYVLTILTNTSRIVLSIKGQHLADYFLKPAPHHLIHESIGTFVYLFFLILFYLSANYFLNKLILKHAKPA